MRHAATDQSQTVFLGGAAKASDIQRLNLEPFPRVVFAGRSNVGKSSLLNAIAGIKIARVSAEPGRTREMNFFRWNQSRIPSDRDTWILVDLPGYGYAKVSAELRKQWGKEIVTWLTADPMIRLVVALVDGRHGFQNHDLELVELVRSRGLPFVVAFTKMDKYKSFNQRKKAEIDLTRLATQARIEQFIFVSATAKAGTRPLELLLQQLKNEG